MLTKEEIERMDIAIAAAAKGGQRMADEIAEMLGDDGTPLAYIIAQQAAAYIFLKATGDLMDLSLVPRCDIAASVESVNVMLTRKLSVYSSLIEAEPEGHA